MGWFFVFVLFRAILRNTWVAAAAFVALWVFSVATGTGGAPAVLVFSSILSSLFLWVMVRFGVLPCATMLMPAGLWPLTSDLSAWYADKGLIVVALLLALAVWSFRNALGGRRVLQGDLL
jgi:hypothetical protein